MLQRPHADPFRDHSRAGLLRALVSVQSKGEVPAFGFAQAPHIVGKSVLGGPRRLRASTHIDQV
jgi:hypothetical protein